jgi:hypothetical protein
MAVGKRRFIGIQPIEKWPGKTRSGERSQFRATFTDTLDFLEKELEHLGATEPTLLTLHNPDDVRLDGRLKTDTRKPSYQGVILTFERPARQHEHSCSNCRKGLRRYWAHSQDKSKSAYAHDADGKAVWCDDQKPQPVEFRFPADKYADWKDNVRSIAMVLEGLRMIERHGVKSEAQYAGYKALPEASATAADEGVTRAAKDLAKLAYDSTTEEFWKEIVFDRDAAEVAFKLAAQKHHPDRGGKDGNMSCANVAIATLREHFKARGARA